jgi:hypothetical protein
MKGDFVEYYKYTNIWRSNGGFMAKIPYDEYGRAEMKYFSSLEAARAEIDATWGKLKGFVPSAGLISVPTEAVKYREPTAPAVVPTIPIVPPPTPPAPKPEIEWATFDSQLKALRSTLHDNIIYALNSYETDLERIKERLKAAISK